MATPTNLHASPAAVAVVSALSIVTAVYRSERLPGAFIDDDAHYVLA